MKGRYYWNKRTASDIKAFNLVFQSRYPAETYPKSNVFARRALHLDAALAHPHAVLGSNMLEYDWDFMGGEAEYKKALELDPNDAAAHRWYAQDLGRIGGREQDAISEANRAFALDPLSPINIVTLGTVYNTARRADDAIAVCGKLVNVNPTFAGAHLCLAGAYWIKGIFPKVIDEFKAYAYLSGDRKDSDFASALAQGYRAGGWIGAMREALETRLAQRKTGYSSPYEIATLCANSGNKEGAFRWLSIAYQERNLGLLSLRTNFLLDPIRSDPRFAELVSRVGLPQ